MMKSKSPVYNSNLRPVVNELRAASPLRAIFESPGGPIKSRQRTFERSVRRSRSPRSNTQRQMALMQGFQKRSRSKGFHSKTPESVAAYQRAKSAELVPIRLKSQSRRKTVEDKFEHTNPFYGHSVVKEHLTPSPSRFQNYEGTMSGVASRRLSRSLNVFSHHRGTEKPFFKLNGKLLYRNVTSSDRKHKGSLFYYDDLGDRRYRPWSRELERAYDAHLREKRSRS